MLIGLGLAGFFSMQYANHTVSTGESRSAKYAVEAEQNIAFGDDGTKRPPTFSRTAQAIKMESSPADSGRTLPPGAFVANIEARQSFVKALEILDDPNAQPERVWTVFTDASQKFQKAANLDPIPENLSVAALVANYTAKASANLVNSQPRVWAKDDPNNTNERRPASDFK